MAISKRRRQDDDPQRENSIEAVCALRRLVHYLAISDDSTPSDIILGLGSNYADVALCAVELFRQRMARRILFAGGRGRLTGDILGSEAAYFRHIAIDRGVPDDAILVEEASSNTLENVLFGHALLSAHAIEPSSIILVTHPLLQRRACATALRQWPGVRFVNCPPAWPSALEDMPPDDLRDLGRLAVGEIERLVAYGNKGDIEPQPIPDSVREATATVQRLLAE